MPRAATITTSLLLSLLLVSCTVGADDPVLRTTVDVRIDGHPLRMDLVADPPSVQLSGDDADVGPVDLEAARSLLAWLRALPDTDPDCAVTVVPRFQAEVWELPPPDVAEFADAAVFDVGGPCDDLDDAGFAEFVRLWNAAGGALSADG